MGKIWDYIKEEERREQLRGEIKKDMRKEWERTNTCKKCGKIFRGEGYPFQKTIFGKVKNYVCEDCAKQSGLI